MAKISQKNSKTTTPAATPSKEKKIIKKDANTTSSSDELTLETLIKTVSVLKQMDSAANEGAALQLLDDNNRTVSLNFNFNKVPEKMRWTPKIVELPHPIYKAPRETCLIVKDPQRKYKDLLIEKPVPGIAKVIGLSKLRANYKSIQQKIDLCNAFDLFICDRDVNQHMPDCLGTNFFKKSKMPIPLRFNNENISDVLKSALNSTFIRVPSGSSMAVKIGHVGMETAELAANAMAVFKAAQVHFSAASEDPIAKDLKVMRCSLHTTDLTTIPIWLNRQALQDGFKKAQEALATAATATTATA